MGKDVKSEMPFEYLRRKENGEKFSDEIVRNWYFARRYVLDKFAEVKVGFEPKSDEHLHVVVDGDSPMMLAVARQVALTAHFVNFMEGNEMAAPKNQTVLTIVSCNPHIIAELEKEEYLCNLPKYCKIVNRGVVMENEGYYIDIVIDIVDNYPQNRKESNLIFISEDEVNAFCKGKNKNEICGIDTRMSVFANRIYDLGAELYNIPAEDIHCAERYSLALDVFQHEKLKKDAENMVTEKWNDLCLCRIKENISNILCSDCFAIREVCMEKICEKNNCKSERWGRYNEPLSLSEHARWVVEKLIMGYRPLTKSEHYRDECLHVQVKNKDKKKKYRDSLKRIDKDPAHIDLCSYRDLRRINPDDLKFDSFLMLAIPSILDRLK